MKPAGIALACALTAAVVRVPLLWDDPFAPGYDGWYYVLQVRSLLSGAPLFADRSLVFAVLAVCGAVLDDVVVGNKVAACLFAAVGAAGAAVGAWRWTASRSAALVAGMWWALAPGHLAVSLEFLKNEGGLAILGLLLAVLPGLARPGSATLRMDAMWTVLLVLVGALTHKLTGVLGLLLAAGVGLTTVLPRLRWRSKHWVVIGVVAGVLLVLVGGLGVLRGVDLQRFLAPQPGEGARLDLLLSSRRIHGVHRVALLAAHGLPLALAAVVWRRELRGFGVPLIGLAGVVAAPLLPFGFDLTAWRLLLLAFVPASFALALLVARTHWGVGVVLSILFFATAPSTVAHTARAEPDYAAWAEVVPTLQASVPPDARVVAHRGLCGFVWAVADRVCENFDPQGPPEGWWRIVYGMGEARLAPYSAVPPVRLKLGYSLVPEAAWRAFRAEHKDTLPLVHHPRNPYRPRPGFVYGPGGETPGGE